MHSTRWGMLFNETDPDHVDVVGAEDMIRIIHKQLAKDGLKCELTPRLLEMKTADGSRTFTLCLRVTDDGCKVIRAVDALPDDK
jgi:hypothetical protein